MTEELKTEKFPKRIRNASITEVFIGYNDKHELTSWIVMNFGKHQQGFGGLSFSSIDPQSSQVTFNAIAANFIAGVLDVIGVQHTGELAGKAVRVYHDDKKVYSIGHYTLDKWLDIDSLKIEEREHPEGITETIDVDGQRHYGLEVASGEFGANIQELKKTKD